jgi:CubicO group peptidase (beta-lactamase class C family)
MLTRVTPLRRDATIPRVRRYAMSFALPLLLLAPLVAQQDKTDEFINAQLRAQNIPGLALAIVKDGKVINAAGYGYAISNGKFR